MVVYPLIFAPFHYICAPILKPMRISLNLLKTCLPVSLDVDEISALLTDIGLEVEVVEHIGRTPGQLCGVISGLVCQVSPHPNADRLRLTKIDVGSSEMLSIVCGSPNVAVGQKVAVATVGALLYPMLGQPVEIKKSKIRGEVSEGMLCAEDELGLSESHEGIMVLSPDTPVGRPLYEALTLESDVVFEIGLTPNRTDAMSHFGVARDLAAAIQTRGLDNVSAALPPSPVLSTGINAPIEIRIEDVDACPRYAGVLIEDVKVAPSPDWLQSTLRNLGIGPINNIVDITNYVLHLCGQPLHAFDADKICGNTVIVRKSREGESFETLDGKTRKPESYDLLICDEQKPMCFAGVFGGLNSGVSADTTNVFLESAFFAPQGIRKTARRHDLHTDAAFRFERGADPEMCLYAAQKAAALICEIAGGRISGDLIDQYPNPQTPAQFAFDPVACMQLGGIDIPVAETVSILRRLGIHVNDKIIPWQLEVPLFKRDVQSTADVVEEILRIYGFDKIPVPAQMRISIDLHGQGKIESLRRRASAYLASNGWNETMCLSFDTCTSAGRDALCVINPLMADAALLRTSLRPGILRQLAYNLNRQEKNLKLFEFGRTYHSIGENVEEREVLALGITGEFNAAHWRRSASVVDAFHLTGVVQGILDALVPGAQKAEMKKTDTGLVMSVEQQPIAQMDATNKKDERNYDLRQTAWVVEIDAQLLWECALKHRPVFSELPRYPAIRRDLALVISESVSFDELRRIAQTAGPEFLCEVQIFDVFRGGDLLAGTKSYALNFLFRSSMGTLSDEEVDGAVRTIYSALQQKAGARLRVGSLD